MNTKLAKKLRKHLGYHPTMERDYVVKTVQKRYKEKDVIVNCNSLTLDPDSPRAKYQQAKKDLR